MVSTIVSKLSKSELQYIFYRFTKEQIKDILCVSETDYYKLRTEHGLKTSTEYLKSLGSEKAKLHLAQFNSRAEMAKYYAVSKSFIDTLLPVTSPLWKIASHLDVFAEDTLESMYHSLMGKVGSRTIVAKLLDVPMSQLPKTDRSVTNQVQNGRESSKGQKAESLYADIRKEHIVTDKNAEDPRGRWDFTDDILGRVNVKSSKAYYSRRRKDYYFKFSLSGKENADHFAFFGFDKNFAALNIWFVGDSSSMPEGKSTASFYLKDLKKKLMTSACGAPFVSIRLDKETSKSVFKPVQHQALSGTDNLVSLSEPTI